LFKKCILHIGTEKTGTTTIQAMFRENRAVLAEQGFFVPKSMGGNEHIDLVSYIVNPKKKFSRRILLDLNDAKAVEEHKEKIGAKFHQELSAAATRGDTLIISSERLFALVTFEHEIRELRDLLMQYCESFEVVCYIRPQHEFAFSLHSTMLRKGINRPNALPDFDVPSREARKYNYNRVLLFWERHFPSAKFTIRRFTKKHLIDGNAVHDFANVAGIDLEPLTIPEHKNLSLGSSAQRILFAYNRFAPDNRIFDKDLNRRRLIRLLGKVLGSQGSSIPVAEQKAFYDRYARTNRMLKKRYFPDSKELFDFPFGK